MTLLHCTPFNVSLLKKVANTSLLLIKQIKQNDTLVPGGLQNLNSTSPFIQPLPCQRQGVPNVVYNPKLFVLLKLRNSYPSELLATFCCETRQH